MTDERSLDETDFTHAEIVSADGRLVARVYPNRLTRGDSLVVRFSNGPEIGFFGDRNIPPESMVVGTGGGGSGR